VTRSGNIVRVSHFPTGVVLEATVVDPTSFSQYYMDARVYVPESYQGQIEGLLGNFDGDAGNEFRRRDGTELTSSQSSTGLMDCMFEMHYYIIHVWDIHAGSRKTHQLIKKCLIIYLF